MTKGEGEISPKENGVSRQTRPRAKIKGIEPVAGILVVVCRPGGHRFRLRLRSMFRFRLRPRARLRPI